MLASKLVLVLPAMAVLEGLDQGCDMCISQLATGWAACGAEVEKKKAFEISSVLHIQ